MNHLRLLALLLCSLAPLLHAQTGLTRLGEFKVNTTTSGDQDFAAVSGNKDGFVIVWRSASGSGYDIKAQLYNSAASPVGSEISVATGLSNLNAFHAWPAAAMNARGEFVITWSDFSASTGSSYIIRARRFDRLGNPVGGVFQADSAPNTNQNIPAVAFDDDVQNPQFVIAWQRYNQDGPSSIYFQRFAINGASNTPLGSETRANDSTLGKNESPSIDCTPGGDFVICWTENSGTSGTKVKARRFTKSGVPVDPQDITVASEAQTVLTYPAVAVVPDGRFVVVWDGNRGSTGNDVFAQRFAADGTAAGGAIPVNAGTSGDQRDASVAVDPAGNFTVVWGSDSADGNGDAVACRQFDSSGTPLTAFDVVVNSYTAGNQRPIYFNKAAMVDEDGNLVVAWQSAAQDGSGTGIYADKFYLPNQGPPLTEFRVNTTTTGDQTLPSIATMPDGRFVAVWRGFSGSGNNAIFGQRFDAAGRRFGPEFIVNTSLPASESYGNPQSLSLAPRVAFDSNAGFTVVWVAASDGSSLGIVGRSFPWNPQAAAGSEFPVTLGSLATGHQSQPSIAVAPDGRFAVAWLRYEESGEIVQRPYIQFFAANGTPGTSAELGVNFGYEQVVAYSPLGRFIVAWRQSAPPPGSLNLRLHEFDLQGVFLRDLLFVDDPGDGLQESPSLAIQGDGSMIVAWETVGTEGNGTSAVHAQRLDANAGRIGASFRVNTFTLGDQIASSVAGGPGSDFIVCYRSPGLDGSGQTVAAQRFTSGSGTPQKDGSEIVVNQFKNGDQSSSGRQGAIVTDAFGNYVIVWQSENQDGSGYGVYATKVFVITPPVVTTGEATNRTASTATLNGTVTPNDVAVDVSFELAESEAGLDTAGVTTTPAVPASLAAGLTTPQAVSKAFTGLTLGIGNTQKTYYYRTKATPSGGAPIYGETVAFTVENTPPEAMNDTFIILGNEALDPIKQFTASGTPGRDTDADPGDTLKIVFVNAPTVALLGTPAINPDQKSITYNSGDLFEGEPGGDSFSYTIEDSRGAQATAVVRVFHVRTVAGLYSGLIGADGGGTASGRLDVMLTRLGQVTGSFKWQGQLYTFKNSPLGPDGTLTVSKPKVDGGGAVLGITLTLNPTTKILTGKLTDNSTDPATVADAEVTGAASVDDLALEDLPAPGTYSAYIDPGTVSAAAPEIAPEAGAPVLPRGLGFSQIIVKGKATSRSRPARTVGRMPDDRPFSSGSRALIRALRAATGQAKYPLYVDNLYPRLRNAQDRLESGGVVSGDLGFTRTGSQFDSDLNWERRANPTAPRFQGGIRGLTAVLNAIRYGRPPAGALPIGIRGENNPNAKLDLREGDLGGTSTQSFRLTRSGSGGVRVQVLGVNPQSLKLSVSANGGKFSGSFIHPADAALPKPPRTKFNGVFKAQDGQGVFTGPTTTGRIQVLAQ